MVQDRKLKQVSKKILDPYDFVSTTFRDNYEVYVKMAKMGWKIVKIMKENHGFLYFQQTILQSLIRYKNQMKIQVKTIMKVPQKKDKYSMWMKIKIFQNTYEIFSVII